MKFRNVILLLLFVTVLCGVVFYLQQPKQEPGCPLEGSAKAIKLQQLNKFKNRSEIPNDRVIDRTITLAKMLEPGEDVNRWNENSGAEIVGYVADVKVGGVETCNCKAQEEDDRDTHIELVQNATNYTNNQKIIIEVTPRLRKIMAAKGIDWSTRTLRDKFLGRWVKVKGWMLFDFEHERSAENTHPGNERNWRVTSWEIHPITSIEVTTRPTMRAEQSNNEPVN